MLTLQTDLVVDTEVLQDSRHSSNEYVLAIFGLTSRLMLMLMT